MPGHRILLVEDEAVVREIARTSLQSLGGHEVLAVSSGDEAMARATGFRPELLVLDVNMPGLDGPATLKALRALPGLGDVPALFLTARTLAREVAQLRSLGAVDVIAKPFRPRELCDRVAQVLAGGTQHSDAQDARPVALLVEDEAGIAYLIRFILEQQGWRVLSAPDGESGLQAIEQGEVAAVVLLDIMLPGIDGLALLEKLRALPRWKDVPVMMLTGRGDEASVSRALAAGADDYLGKPFEPADLVARIRKLAAR